MNQAVAMKSDELPSLELAPSTPLTPMQMAYQLVAKGADFASVREMLDYARGIEREQAEAAFNVAMTECQAEMRPVAANSYNTQTKSKYATYDALDQALREIYTKHGFSPSFDEGEAPASKPDHVRVLCYLAHKSGHSRTYKIDMPADGKGAKGGDVMTKTHATGSAFSYGQRYLLGMMFNIAITGKRDDDGNAAGKAKPSPLVTPEQVKTLRELIEKAGTTVEKFCSVAKIEAIPDLEAIHFDAAKKMLTDRIKAVAAKAAPKVDPKAQFDKMERGNA